MRLSRVVKDYIETKVNECFPPTKEEIAYRTFCKENEEMRVIFEKEATEMLKKLFDAQSDDFKKRFYLDSYPFVREYGEYCTQTPKTEMEKLYKSYRDADKIRTKERKDALNNIYVSLELGGNKKDLENLLMALKEERGLE